jgi:hypothetical protein
MTRDEAIDIATKYARDNNFLIAQLEIAKLLPAAPPIRDREEWSVVFENGMVRGSALVFTVDPRTKRAELFEP